MRKISGYGAGCGVLLTGAGVVQLLFLLLGWDTSSSGRERVSIAFVKLLGEAVGSPYLGAILSIVLGIVIAAFWMFIQELFTKKQLVQDQGGSGSGSLNIPGSPYTEGQPYEESYTPSAYSSYTPQSSYEVYVPQPSKSYMPEPAPNYYEPSPVDTYLSSVENRMIYSGFEPIQFSADTHAYYKRDSQKSSECYFVLGCANGMLMPEKVQKISQRTFDFVSKKKQANVLYCYPVILTENVPPSVQKFIESYAAKHTGQFEFPVIVDLSAQKLYYYPGTPLWGLTTYGDLRKDADLLLGSF